MVAIGFSPEYFFGIRASGMTLWLFALTRFLYANRYPLRSKTL
jgi:hypothetical protein